MNHQNLRKQNRIWIIFNYLSLITVLTFFYIGKHFQWSSLFIVIEIVSLLIFLITFLRIFIKTKFWKMVHTSSKKLDEREMQVVLNAVKSAYSIFAIVCLVIIYFFATTEFHPIDIILAGALLYLAHTLPAAIVGWNEKIITLADN